jgi:hypothetical protein
MSIGSSLLPEVIGPVARQTRAWLGPAAVSCGRRPLIYELALSIGCQHGSLSFVDR